MNSFLLLSALAAATTGQQLAAPPQDPDADGPELEATGDPLPNFAEVSSGVFRSAQPDPADAGLALAKAKGVKTVLSLRLRWREGERAEARKLGLETEQVRMNGVYSPTYSQVDRALEILTDPELQPVLVHCHYGKDRTGVVVASYRVIVEGWSVLEAVEEAGKFGPRHPLFVDLREWLVGYQEHRAAETAR